MVKVNNYSMVKNPSNGMVKVLQKEKVCGIVENLLFDDFECTNNFDEDVVITKKLINGKVLSDELYSAFSLNDGKIIQIYSVYQDAFVGELDENGDVNLDKTIAICIDKLNNSSLEKVNEAKKHFQKIINSYKKR